MGLALPQRVRALLDRALPLPTAIDASTTRRGTVHGGADLLFPLNAVVDGCYVTPGAALNVNVSGGLVRDANGVVRDVPPQTNILTLAAPATTGQKIVYTVYYDPVAGAYNAVASPAAPNPAASAPPLNTVAVATVTVPNGATAVTQAMIDNSARLQF